MPEDIGSAVAIEIADTDHMPTTRNCSTIGDYVTIRNLPIIPYGYCAVIIVPQNVRLPIAIEIAQASNMPTTWNDAWTDNPMTILNLPVIPN